MKFILMGFSDLILLITLPKMMTVLCQYILKSGHCIDIYNNTDLVCAYITQIISTIQKCKLLMIQITLLLIWIQMFYIHLLMYLRIVSILPSF